jgi:HD-GYP domain-containing protein (c-di-GMP phosphodiesterase class II)
VATIVRATHERCDGEGYPDGISGEAIPLAARIIAVCDAYDAIVSARPYRPAADHAQALAELRHCAGAQFDPRVVNAFVAEFPDRGPESDPSPLRRPEDPALTAATA